MKVVDILGKKKTLAICEDKKTRVAFVFYAIFFIIVLIK